MIQDNEGIDRYYVSKPLKAVIDRVKEKINNEDSMFICILWGAVGSGKSVRAMHLGHAVDTTLRDPSRICFEKDEFIKAVLNNRKASIVGDEGIALFFSRGSMSKEGRLMAELMAQCRQKNLALFICVPEILSVDWLVLKASNMVCYVYESHHMVDGKLRHFKGNMNVYPRMNGADYVQQITHYLRMRRVNPKLKLRMPEPYIMEPGSMIGGSCKSPWYPIPEDVYRDKKESILNKYRKKHEDIVTVASNDDSKRDMAFRLFDDQVSTQDVSKSLKISTYTAERYRTQYNLVKKYKNSQEKEGFGSLKGAIIS